MNRRNLLKIFGVLAGGWWLANYLCFSRGMAVPFSLPVENGINVERPRVIQVHHADVCSWTYGDGDYIEGIDFKAVKKMMETGVVAFAGTATPAEAWKRIIRPYRRGEKIAIKPNLNNTRIGYREAIMTSPHVVQALLESLLESGFPAEDIIVYDLTAYDDQVATQSLRNLGVATLFPNRKRNILEHKIHRVARKLHFGLDAPDMQAPIRMQKNVRDKDGNDVQCFIPKVLSHAQHLINVPVFKAHQFVLQSSALKNHFGTVRFSNLNSFPVVLHGQDIEWHIADINANPHIRDKTRLTIVDAILGAGCFFRGDLGRKPTRWRSLATGDTPASLFFSRDPVAVESVLADIVITEQRANGFEPYSHEYLHLSSALGLGVHDHHDDSGHYRNLDFSLLTI